MDELIGLRDEDLTDAERAQRDALLTDPVHGSAQQFADTLGSSLRPLAEADGGPAVLPEPSRKWGMPVGGLALAAAAVLALGWWSTGEEGRWKGATHQGSVQIDAFAEGADGLRPLQDGSEVAPAERVVFRLRTVRPGSLFLDEVVDGGRTAVMAEGSLPAGEHMPGGGQPASWRPDRPIEGAVYEARWCAEDEPTDCVTDRLRLRWSTP